MSLATRCPTCSTVFRVVQDQLRVSEGWVRCGRCTEVFNAVEALVNLDTTVRLPPAPERPAVERDDFFVQDSEFESTRPPADEPLDAGSRGGELIAAEPQFIAPSPIVEDPALLALAKGIDPAKEIHLEPTLDTGPFLRQPDASSDEDRSVALAEAPGAAGTFAAEAPSFVQTADRAARWQRPGVHRGLWLLALFGLLGLLLQVGYEFRAQAVARWPELQPLVGGACEHLGCRIEALRQIESLSVDSSGLTRSDDTAPYRLAVVLRNKADLAVAVPSLDLSLTDAQGKIIARRVLPLSELGVSATTIAAGAEMPVQAALSVSDRQVVGYTVEIFYP